jgi:hypothetical protein
LGLCFQHLKGSSRKDMTNLFGLVASKYLMESNVSFFEIFWFFSHYSRRGPGKCVGRQAVILIRFRTGSISEIHIRIRSPHFIMDLVGESCCCDAVPYSARIHPRWFPFQRRPRNWSHV